MDARRALRVSLVFVALGSAALGLAACGGAGVETRGSAPSSSATSPDQTSAPPDQANAASERKVVINSSLNLHVEKIAPAYTQVVQIARAAGGFVADSSVTGDGNRSTASARIRVPASTHDSVVAALRSLAIRVGSESTNAREVTDEYTDLQSRLRNLQRSEAQYQTLLGQARSVDEILNVDNRIDGVRGQVEQTQGRINLLDDLTDFATINVSLSLPPAAVGQGIPTPDRVLVGAWHFSQGFALVLANLAVVLAVALLWAVPFGALGLGSWRIGRLLAPVARRWLE